MTPAGKLALGLTLTAAAGFLDAVGFVELNGLYTSFMSGNTTQLGIHIGEGLWTSLPLPAALLSCFFCGSFAGSVLALQSSRHGSAYVLAAVSTLILLALALTMGGIPPALSLLPLALAAGMQNAALPPAGAARLGATFVTGTLFSAGQDLARALYGHAPRWRFAQHLLVWVSLLLGALVGGTLHGVWGNLSLLIPLAAYLLCLAVHLPRPAVRRTRQAVRVGEAAPGERP